jgi:hypothetical protein
MKYEIVEVKDGLTMIKQMDAEGIESWIPNDPANADYQAYLNKDTLPSELVEPAPAEKPKK